MDHASGRIPIRTFPWAFAPQGRRRPSESTAQPSRSSASTYEIGGLPMKEAAKQLTGSAYMVWGGATCCTEPWRMRTISSVMLMASS